MMEHKMCTLVQDIGTSLNREYKIPAILFLSAMRSLSSKDFRTGANAIYKVPKRTAHVYLFCSENA